MDNWDDEYATVLPETMTETVKTVVDKYPNKRLLIHYIQPHYPFIGSNLNFGAKHLGEDPTNSERGRTELLDPWMRIMTNQKDFDSDQLWDAYKQNLSRVLNSVTELVQSLLGKTVITSDHGNMFGERATPIPIQEWGHPRGVFTKELAEVPWFTIQYGDRREILNGSTSNVANIDSDVVEERLRDLGYV
jgi:membrane-anchored protein YejM (alkaline phosphatase superfamily)